MEDSQGRINDYMKDIVVGGATSALGKNQVTKFLKSNKNFIENKLKENENHFVD